MQTSPERTKALTLTEAAVLCLLAVEGECSGYDLLKRASRSVGHVWTPAKSQLYTVLPRLARSGLASARSVVQSDRPDKQLYRLTEEGEAALRQWLTTLEPDDDDAFRLRVFYGGLMPTAALVAHVETYRERLLEQIAVFDEIDQTNTERGHDWYHRLLLDYGYARARASLHWSEDVLSKLRRRR